MSSTPLVFARNKAGELQSHLREFFIGMAGVACMCVSAAAVSIAIDIHSMRVANLAASVQLQSALTSRLDSLLWKADTFLTIESAMSKSLSTGLTQVRVQVEQSSQDQRQAVKAAETATAKAVETTITQAAAAITEAASSQPAPVVHVEPAKPTTVAAPAVTVTPVIAQPTKSAKPAPETDKRSHWRWIRYLWPLNWHASRSQ